MTEIAKNNWQRWAVWAGIIGILAVGLFLRVYRLTDDLPYVDLGASGAFLLDEGFYQVSAAHKAMFGEWQMPGVVYGGWTVRAYQMWIFLFFKMFGVTLFAARLACATAFMLSLAVMLGVLRKYVAPRVVLVFGILSATNYLLVMWPRMALPYAVALLPASGVLLFTLLAVTKRSVICAVGAATFAFLCGAVKEPAVLFFPIGLLTCIVGFRLYHGVTLWKAVWNRVVATYIMVFALLFVAYQFFFLMPVTHEWWNDSAQQARDVVRGAMNIGSSMLQTNQKTYGLWEAIEKFCLKFLGMKHMGFAWGLALFGIASVILSPKKLIKEAKSNLQTIITLFMALWAVIMIGGLVVVRGRGGVAIHWSPLYLTPVVYFAALGFHGLWTYFSGNRRVVLARTIALTLFIGAVGYDLMQYQIWIQQLPENSQINIVASQIAHDVLKEEAQPTMVIFDSPIVFLRHPQVNTLSMREFHVEHFSDAYAVWSPQFIVLTNPILRPQSFKHIMESIRSQGFELQPRGNYSLGTFDGSDVELKLYRLKKSA